MELESTVSELSNGCASVFSRLEGTQARTANFLARTEELRQQRGVVEARQTSVQSFLTQYQLSDAETQVRMPCPCAHRRTGAPVPGVLVDGV